jgi:hypothetical protein
MMKLEHRMKLKALLSKLRRKRRNERVVRPVPMLAEYIRTFNAPRIYLKEQNDEKGVDV